MSRRIHPTIVWANKLKKRNAAKLLQARTRSIRPKKLPLSKLIITQVLVSPAIEPFGKFIKHKFGLKNYYNRNLPAFFFGCYKKRDLNKILHHVGARIIIWGGTDADYKKRPFAKIAFRTLRKEKMTYHVAISDYITRDLKNYNISSKRVKLSFTNFNLFPPVTKGPCIYIYTSHNEPHKYGGDIINKVIKQLGGKYKLIVGVNKIAPLKAVIAKYPYLEKVYHVPHSKMIGLYRQCFIGLRLTRHDGNANSVQELGLSGIRCIYNGDPNQPNSISWKAPEDIVETINKEALEIGKINGELSQNMRKYLDTGKSWLKMGYYY